VPQAGTRCLTIRYYRLRVNDHYECDSCDVEASRRLAVIPSHSFAPAPRVTLAVLLDRSAAGDPGIRWPNLDNQPPAVSELGASDLGQVPRTEQHTRGASTEITVAPFGKESIIGHGDQYPVPAHRGG
jgi:hypothetical protein